MKTSDPLPNKYQDILPHFLNVFVENIWQAKLDLMAGQLQPTGPSLRCPCAYNMALNLPCVPIWQEYAEVMILEVHNRQKVKDI